MRLFVLFLSLFSFGFAFSQTPEDTNVSRHQELPAVRYDKHFDLHYKQQLNLIRRTYPLALRAKEIIDSLDIELENAKNNRSKRKIARNTKDELKDEFTYLLKDLYIGEGAMLFKLIERETGLTVVDILEKYKGKIYAKSVQATFALYGQDADSKFDAQGKDWVAETVLQDIESGRLQLDLEIKEVTKEDYKENMKEYREDLKEYRKTSRKKKRKKRKQQRKAKD